jgi:hypothetical protein
MLLCLAAALCIPPLLLTEYFCARRDMLRSDALLYQDHDCIRSQWRNFIQREGSPNYLHATYSFPPTEDNTSWAGAYDLGTPMDPPHLLLLAPSELRRSPTFILNLDGAETETIGVRLPKKQLQSLVMYFPPDATQGEQTTPIFLSLSRGHCKLLSPQHPLKTAADLLSTLPPSCYLPYICHTIYNSQVSDFIALLGLSTPCALLPSLTDQHSTIYSMILESAILLDSETNTGHTAPQPLAPLLPKANILSSPVSQLTSHASSLQLGDTQELLSQASADADAVDLLHPSNSPKASRPESPNSTASPTKTACAATSPQRLGLSVRTAQRMLDMHPPAQPSSSSPSITSSTDLGDLVYQTARKGESKYAARIGVRGDVSSDETSESGSLPMDTSIESSQTPSIVSTGSFHLHCTPNTFHPPLCANNHTMSFGQFHEANHTCDVADCMKPIPAWDYGFHCEQCSMDVCTSCWPINWAPESSQPSDISSQFSLPSVSQAPPCSGDPPPAHGREGL